MKTIGTLVLSSVVLAFVGRAEPGGVVDAAAGTYTIDVGEGQTYELTADDAAAAAGYALVKRGAGTAKAGAELAAFAGEIRVEEGFYWASTNGALGTAAGGTAVSNGATLQVSCAAKDGLIFADESIDIAGVGADGKGALYHCKFGTGNKDYVQQLNLLKSNGRLSLSADATIGGVYNIGFKGAVLTLNGHTLTVAMSGNTTPFNLTFGKIYNDGCIDIRRGRAFFDTSSVYYDGETGSVCVSGKGELAFRNVSKPIPYALVLADGASLYPSQGTSLTGSVNEWAGPVTLNGAVDLNYNDTDATGVHLSGPIGGNGSLEVMKCGILRLSNPGNTFAGGVRVSSQNFGDTLCGLYVDADGAVPQNGPAITNVDGCVIFRGGSMTVPDVVCTTGGFISNAVPGSAVVLGAIEKLGTGDLTVVGGFALTNSLTHGGGIVCLGGYRPGEVGIRYANTNFTDGAALNDYLKAKLGFGLDKSNGNTPDQMRQVFALIRDAAATTNTVAYPKRAYETWPSAEKFSLKAYWGYLRNNEPTNVTYAIASSIADTVGIWIDDQCLFHSVGSKRGPKSDGTSGTATYFVTAGEVVLTPGAHKFDVLTGHFTTTSYGPKESTSVLGMDWADNFGLAIRKGGIDPTQPTNSTDYVAIRNDIGWGTILTTEAISPTDLEREETARRSRPSFAKLGFRKPEAAGVNTLDLGSFAYTTESLAGVGRFTNGVLNVAGAWKAEASELEYGPLAVAAEAGLNFAPTSAFLSDDMRAFEADSSGRPLARVEDGGTLTGVPVAAKGWKIRRAAEELRLYCAGGLTVFVR